MKNILTAINEVMKKVEYVKKGASVQGYKAVTHDEVTAKVRPAMVDAGIVFNISVKNSEMFEAGKSAKGATNYFYKGFYEATFYHCESGESLTESVEAHAMDFGDKAPGKALSYATKAILLKTFLLETGENDESRQEVDRAMTEQQELYRSQLINKINAIASESGKDLQKAALFVTANKTDDILDLSNSQLEKILGSMKNSKGEQNV